MAGLLDAAMPAQAQKPPPGYAEAQQLVQLYEAGKIDKTKFDEGRYRLMTKFGIQIKDTKDPMQAPQGNEPMPMAPLIPIR